MAIFNNGFECPNGHSFNANAKLHARCPECGARAKRDFQAGRANDSAAEPETPDSTGPKPVVPKERSKTPILLRRGRPVAARKTTSTTKKATTTSATKTTAAKKTSPVKSVAPAKISGGLVRTRRVTGTKITPAISRPPKKTAVARFTKAGGKSQSGSYADQMMKRAGF